MIAAVAPAKVPSRPTLYRHIRAARRRVQVLRGEKKKGSRERRFSEEIISLIEAAAEMHFLMPESVAAVGDGRAPKSCGETTTV